MSNYFDELSKIIKNAISVNGSGTTEIEKLGGLVALNRLQQSYLPIKTMIETASAPDKLEIRHFRKLWKISKRI